MPGDTGLTYLWLLSLFTITSWWFQPLWKIWVRQWRDDNRNPILMGKCQKWQPNHQPEIYLDIFGTIEWGCLRWTRRTKHYCSHNNIYLAHAKRGASNSFANLKENVGIQLWNPLLSGWNWWFRSALNTPLFLFFRGGLLTSHVNWCGHFGVCHHLSSLCSTICCPIPTFRPYLASISSLMQNEGVIGLVDQKCISTSWRRGETSGSWENGPYLSFFRI